ncbi:molybdopterin molybdotransferase MoeA [bacterium]|nr:molybdopterin molybdotransferase MoeA [bacterium]
MRPSLKLVEFDEAVEILLNSSSQTETITVGISEALGFVAHCDVYSCVNLPPGDVSAMDGYTLRYDDIVAQRPLEVTGEIPAGSAPDALGRGKCARIFTGAIVPGGADTVVQQELAEIIEDNVVRLDILPRGSNIRKKGEVLNPETKLLSAGEVITPGKIAVLAAGGIEKLTVHRKPRIAILITGNEIDPKQIPIGSERMRDSNGPMLKALSESVECEIVYFEHVRDEMEECLFKFRRASELADIVISTGGVSVGDYDLVPEIVEKLRAKTLFHGVRMKPGKPLYCARLNKSIFLGLPGNSVSALAGWQLFVKPLLVDMQGQKVEEPVIAQLEEVAENKGKRLLFIPGYLRGEKGRLVVSHKLGLGSHDILTASRANCLIRLETSAKLLVGDNVECTKF